MYDFMKCMHVIGLKLTYDFEFMNITISTMIHSYIFYSLDSLSGISLYLKNSSIIHYLIKVHSYSINHSNK